MKKQALPQLVIYDLDGTLIDSVPDIAHAMNCALQALYDTQAPLATVSHWVGNGSLKLVSRALAFARHDQPRAQQASHDDAALEELHQCFLDYYGQHLGTPSPVYDGTHALLAFFHGKGVPQAVATNKPQQFVPRLLKSTGLAPYISALVGGNSLPEKKPHPMPLQSLCRRFQCPPGNALMIGDSQSDALSASSAGIPCWLLEQGYAQGVKLNELGAEHLFANTQALLDHLKNTPFTR